MSKLYMLRHGETLFNVLWRKQGFCDSPLTERGIQQAKNTGAYLREHGISFDHAYSSTSERARDTVELIVPGMPYEALKGLKEWNFGTFEGVTEDVSPRPAKGGFYVQFGGEHEEEFKQRLFTTLVEIMRRPGHENVLAVSHGAACVRFPAVWGFDMRGYLVQNGFAAKSGSSAFGNCAYAVYEFDGDCGFELIDYADPNAE